VLWPSLALSTLAVVSASLAIAATDVRKAHVEYGVLVSCAFGLSTWVFWILKNAWSPKNFAACAEEWQRVFEEKKRAEANRQMYGPSR
jgi:hypothetical protein